MTTQHILEVTPEDVFDLWAELEKVFNLRLLDKKNSEEMALLGEALGTLGIMDKDDFLERYATTIGRSVWLPFELGNPESRNLLSQARTISHEAMHGHQFTSKGQSSWAFKYLSDPDFRAAEEAEALTTSCEVHWLITGKTLPYRKTAEKLRAYALKKKHIDTVAKRLKSAYKTIEHGGIITRVGKVSKRVLQSKT